MLADGTSSYVSVGLLCARGALAATTGAAGLCAGMAASSKQAPPVGALVPVWVTASRETKRSGSGSGSGGAAHSAAAVLKGGGASSNRRRRRGSGTSESTSSAMGSDGVSAETFVSTVGGAQALCPPTMGSGTSGLPEVGSWCWAVATVPRSRAGGDGPSAGSTASSSAGRWLADCRPSSVDAAMRRCLPSGLVPRVLGEAVDAMR